MLKKPENKINWKDSNLALFGSDLEKKIKAAAAGKEDAWKGLGKSVTLRVWRIEKFQVKDWKKSKYGSFHKGDSYIVLNTYKPDPNNEKLNHDIHIWIGDESSQDEYGTAAYKMVELDAFLGGAAVQHRETQSHESDMFSSYFKQHIKYLDGGIESGFRHVEPTKENPHLFHIKGHISKGTIRLTQEPLRRDAMNSGDVFVLVTGEDHVWMWVGKSSNKDEKAKGMQVAKSFCEKGNVKVLDEGVSDGEEEAKDFWKHIPQDVKMLGPLKKRVNIQKADDKDDKKKSFTPILYRTPETLGSSFKKVTKATPTPTGPTKQKLPRFKNSLLKDDHAYLLDTGFHVYIWVGKKANPGVKALAVHHAETYFNSKKRPIMPVTVVKQGMETNKFSEFFVESKGSSCVVM